MNKGSWFWPDLDSSLLPASKVYRFPLTDLRSSTRPFLLVSRSGFRVTLGSQVSPVLRFSSSSAST